jgi:pyridoxine kinase
MIPPKIVCIHSLTAHGVVGLKPFISVLEDSCLPVPSLLLNGPGDMPGCTRFDYDFAGLLDATLAAVAVSGTKAVVFVGYLARAEQVAIVCSALSRFRSAISVVVVDPVSGDQGRRYVSSELIAAWPTLLEAADWAFPNVTEVGLLTDITDDREKAVAALRERFPVLQLVITGWEEGDRIAIRCLTLEGEIRQTHRRVEQHFRGTGDLFAALWLRRFFLQQSSVTEATERAAAGVLAAIEAAQESGSRDLAVVRR